MIRILAFLLFTVVAFPAATVPIDADINGDWLQFQFGAPGSGATGCAGGDCTDLVGGPWHAIGDGPWTFLAGQDVRVTIWDMFLIGDEFELLDLGVPLGFTSPAADDGSCGNDISVCLGSAASRGIYFLGGGVHSLTIAVSDSLLGGGTAIFRVDTVPVPVPGTLLIFAMGLLVLAGSARRRA